MLITLTCHLPDAPRIGYLLGKHPDSLFERPFSMGTVRVFYPAVAEDAVTVALLVEVDPIGLVRRPTAGLDQYVNDRPYVASSITSVALRVAFGAAMAGRNERHPDLVDARPRWVVRLPAVACDAGADLITRLFAPLGYRVSAERLPLDPHFPAWGPADLYALELDGEQTTADVLSHLYVLLPVLDNSKHYYIGADEIEKLLAHGGTWLAAHPERETITRRYLRYRRPLVESALARLAEGEPVPAEEEGGAPEALAEAQIGLHEQRLHAVMAALRAIGARSLADLGCGEGKLLALALGEPGLERMLGMDVSTRALASAARRLHLETLPAAQRARLTLAQGSLLYRDRRLAGFDGAALVEVIEHLDAARLAAMEQVVFAHARPRRVVVTTPNREYNAHWPALAAGHLRHPDHRFEWTRAQCQAWAERVAATYGYRAQRQELGPLDAQLGAPSQLVIFDRAADTPAGEQGTSETEGGRDE